MKVLMLGGTGFLGRNLAAALTQRGIEVIATGRSQQAGALDLSRPATFADVLDAVRPDTIVHLASGLKPGSDEAAYLRERVDLIDPTCALTLECARRGIDFVFMSSGGTVYGATANALCHEDDTLRPISFYGQSKVELENFVRFVGRTQGLRYLIVRPSNPYGPHQAFDGPQGLVAVALGRMARGLPLDVWGDGRAARDYIHVEDMSAAVAALIAGPHRNETINIGSGESHSLLDVVAMIEQVTGTDLPLRFRPARTVDVPRVVLATDKLRRMIDFRPRTLAKGLSDYIVYLQDQGQWPASQ